jgi:hypothetical protein
MTPQLPQKAMTETSAPALAPNTKSFSGSYLLWRKVGTKLRRPTPGGNGGNPRFRHPTFASAETEAGRLLGLFPADSFVILQEVARVKLVEAPENAIAFRECGN